MVAEKVEAMGKADTPASVIKSAIDEFEFICFVAEAINHGRITPSTFLEEVIIDTGRDGLVLKKRFTAAELAAGAKNTWLMALGTTAIATDKAMYAVFGDRNPDDTSELGSARAIVYQIRCAFAHDPLNPVWTPKPKYKHKYCITVNVPHASGKTTTCTIELHPPSLSGKHLSGEDFGGLGGYFALLNYSLKQVESHPRGSISYVPAVEL